MNAPATARALPKHMFEVDFSEEGHVYSKGGESIISVTQVIEAQGLRPRNDFSDRAAVAKSKVGTEVHKLSYLHFTGENVLRDYEIDDRVKGYFESLAQLVELVGFQCYLAEFGPYGATVNGMKFGFKIDAVGMIPGYGESVVEVKTTAEEEAHHGVQTAGYDTCLGGPRRARFVMQTFKDGKIGKLIPYTEQSDYDAFLYSLWLETWKRNKGVVR